MELRGILIGLRFSALSALRWLIPPFLFFLFDYRMILSFQYIVSPLTRSVGGTVGIPGFAQDSPFSQLSRMVHAAVLVFACMQDWLVGTLVGHI